MPGIVGDPLGGCLVGGVKNFEVSHWMFQSMSEGVFDTNKKN
jgi:hypothetical protein